MLDLRDLIDASSKVQELKENKERAVRDFVDTRMDLMTLGLKSVKGQIKGAADMFGLDFTIEGGAPSLIGSVKTEFISLHSSKVAELGADKIHANCLRFRVSIKNLVSLSYTIGFATSPRYTAEGRFNSANECRLIPVVLRELSISEGSKLETPDYGAVTTINKLGGEEFDINNFITNLLTEFPSAEALQKSLDDSADYMEQELESLLAKQRATASEYREFKDNLTTTAEQKVEVTFDVLLEHLEGGMSRAHHERILKNAMLNVRLSYKGYLTDNGRGERLFENLFPHSEWRKVDGIKLSKPKRSNSKHVELALTGEDGVYTISYNRLDLMDSIRRVSQHLSAKSTLELLGDFEVINEN